MKMQVKYIKKASLYSVTASHTHSIFNQRPPVSESIMGYMSVPSVPVFFTEETTSHRTQEGQ